MKWERPQGSIQRTADGRYEVQWVNSEQWVAYELGPTTGIELGVAKSDDAGRQLCEDHERKARRKSA